MNRKSVSSLWFKKANNDLEWTKANIREKIYYGACFSAQQSVEKALKAYLYSRGYKIPKIHDLGALVEECKRFDNDFEKILELSLPLSDYYIEARYPDIGDLIGFNEEKAKDALGRAEKIFEFVRKKLT